MLSIFRRLKARGLAYNLVWPFKGGVAALVVVVVEEQLAPSNFCSFDICLKEKPCEFQQQRCAQCADWVILM